MKSFTTEQTEQQTTLEQRAEALRLLDRAIEAKHGELLGEALRLAQEARQIDPRSPGVDVFIGELAFAGGQIDVMGSAARSALQQQPASASGKLLLALHAWILGGQTANAEPRVAAAELLKDAAADELSNGAVRFFAGDFLRSVGRPAEAHGELLGSLYRQHPWHSAAIISAKLSLAFEEAGPLIKPSSASLVSAEGESVGNLSVALYRAIRGSGDISAAGSALQSILTHKQFGLLISDPALSPASETLSGSNSGFFVPFGHASRSQENLPRPFKTPSKK